jgi:predicted nucleotidyltransferase component of viral defense system
MDIFTPFQRTFLKAFAGTPLNAHFYLTGGTALAAFYLRHRLSDDLDFFTSEGACFPQVLPTLTQLSTGLGFTIKVERSFPTFFDADLLLPDGSFTKIDFAVDSPYRLQPLVHHQELGITIDNQLDLCCNKLSALFDRAEPKDFVDVYFILNELYPWETLLAQAQKKHVGLEPHFLAKALLRVQDVELLPRLVKPLDLKDLRAFFLTLARQLMDQLQG